MAEGMGEGQKTLCFYYEALLWFVGASGMATAPYVFGHTSILHTYTNIFTHIYIYDL